MSIAKFIFFTKKRIALTRAGFCDPGDFLPGKKKISGGAQFWKHNNIRSDVCNQFLHAGKVFFLISESGSKLNNG